MVGREPMERAHETCLATRESSQWQCPGWSQTFQLQNLLRLLSAIVNIKLFVSVQYLKNPKGWNRIVILSISMGSFCIDSLNMVLSVLCLDNDQLPENWENSRHLSNSSNFVPDNFFSNLSLAYKKEEMYEK